MTPAYRTSRNATSAHPPIYNVPTTSQWLNRNPARPNWLRRIMGGK